MKKPAIFLLVACMVLNICCFVVSENDICKASDYVIDESVSCFDNSTVQISSRPSVDKVLEDYNASSLKGVHPRLMATREDFDRIKALCETDMKMSGWYSQLIHTADNYLTKDTLVYELRDGVRLWYVALDLIDYMQVLGLAYQLTGEDKYASKAYEHMVSAASFPDWNPEHRIDIGGMSAGIAIGYDWTYDYMTESQRKTIEDGFFKNGGITYVQGYQGYDDYIAGGIMAANNHNAIMNGGAVMAAIAMFDVYSRDAAYLISNALRGCEYSLHKFAPDGLWYEGIGYSALELEYCSYLFASMHKLFGTSYGLDSAEGLDTAVNAFLQMNSALGAYAYGDTSSATPQYDPAILWFANHYQNDDVISKYGRIFGFDSSDGDLARTILWYDESVNFINQKINKDMYFSGTEVAVMRDQWSTSSKAFVGIKGGMPAAEHGHMDIGDFAYYSNGARWAVDLGGENYNLDGFWDTSDKGKRWSYYGMRAEAHNCLVIDPGTSGGFKSSVSAPITRFESKENGVIAVVDSTNSYDNWKLKSAQRGFYFADNRNSLVIRDEIQTSTILSSNIYWFMQTGQNCEINGNKVILTDKNDSSNQVILEFLCNTSFEISIGNSEPLLNSLKVDGLVDRSGYKRIILKTSGKGNINITAKLTPSNITGTPIADYDKSISTWTIPDGTLEKNIEIASSVSNLILPSGAKAKIYANLTATDGDETIEYYNVKNGVESLIGTCFTENPEIEVNVGKDNYIVAKLVKNGTVLATSNMVKTLDNYLINASEHWNVNFDNHTLSGTKDGYICDSNGNRITNSYQETLQCNAGISGLSNFSIVENVEAINKNNGMSLKATVTNGDNLQLNEFRTIVSDGYVVFAYDYCVDDFSTNRTVGLLHYYSEGTRYTGGGITLSMGGWLKVGDAFLKKIYPNTWINIKEVVDIANRKIHILFDDVYYTTVNIPRAIDSTYKLAITTLGTSGNFWVDNFEVYEMSAVSTDLSINISSIAEGKNLPAGTLVPITVETGEVDGNIVFYEVDYNGNMEPISSLGSDTKYTIPLRKYAQNICAAVLSDNGESIVYSNIISFNGMEKNLISELWNIDFETHTFKGGFLSDKNGNKLTNSRGDYIQVNSGSANSSFTICDNESASKNNGMSLKASVSNKDMVQMNEFRGTVRSNYAIWSYDYCVPDFSADRTIGHIAYYKTGSSSWVTTSALTLSQGKWLKVDGDYLKQIEANVWYKITFVIDISGDIAHVLLDDIYLTSILLPDIERTFKMRVFVQNSASGDYWIDNINVGEYTLTEIDKGFGNVCYMINGEKVEKMAAGTLTLIPTVIGDTDEFVYCIAAIYDGDKMVYSQIKKLDMKNGTYLKPEFCFKEVTENMKVKIFLIGDLKNMKPLSINSELD